MFFIHIATYIISFSPGDELPESKLQLVQIYFDTATFDKIERDKQIKTDHYDKKKYHLRWR